MITTEAFSEIIQEVQTTEFLEKLAEYKKVLNKVFGEENNQIIDPLTLAEHDIRYKHSLQTSSMPTNLAQKRSLVQYQFVLKFPQFEIFNSQGGRHTIRDYYLLTNFTANLIFTAGLMGFRGTYTPAEVAYAYNHSHQSGCFSIGAMCTGSGPLSEIYADWGRNIFRDIEQFEAYCRLLYNYVRYESIEGTPHKRMPSSGRTNSGHQINGFNLSTEQLNRIYRIVFNIEDLADHLVFDAMETIVDINAALEERLVGIFKSDPVLGPLCEQNRAKLLAYKVGRTYYTNPTESIGEHTTREQAQYRLNDVNAGGPNTGNQIYFKRQVIKAQLFIEENQNQNQNERQFQFLSPYLRSRIVTRLCEELYVPALRHSYASAQSTPENNQPSTEPNIAAV